MAFDASYYQRRYHDPGSRVHAPDDIAKLAAGVLGLVEWFGLPVHRVLDVGAGTGEWGRYLASHRPDIAVRALDVSEHACATYGHEHHDIATWCDPDARFDLIICQGVLGYLDDNACAAAIDNIATMCDGFLYLFLTSRDDLDASVVDTKRTDLSVHIRPDAFYRALLEPHFMRVGGGLFAHHHAPVSLFACERA